MPRRVTAARAQWWRSVRVRVTAGATLVFAIAFVAAAVLLVNRVHASLEDEVRRESNDTVLFLKGQIESGAPLQGLRASNPNPSVGYILVDGQGRVVETSGPTAAGLAVPPGRTFEQDVPDTRTERAPPPGPDVKGGSAGGAGVAGPGEVISVAAEASTPDGPVTIKAAGPLDGVRQSIDTLTRWLTFGTPVLIAIVGALIFVFVGRALRPVDALCAEVQEITHSTLHRRIEPAGANDEMDRLAHTMNDMLDRLESAADRQRQFVSDASHELKTPLTTIRTSVEVALRQPAEANWEEIGRRVLAADSQMEDLVNDLLDLARLDELEGDPAAAFRAIDLEELVLDRVHEHAGPIELDVEGIVAGRVDGDRRSLDRLVRNLVGNAVTHARSRVRVTVEENAGWVELIVDDDGPGIPLDARRQVFARFTRLEESRTASGTGLGLAIAKAVVDRHGGTIEVGDAPLGGARFTARLPAAASTG
jgi:signal transduction histidine kinase